ncbi:hypothetical protein [Halalkalibaculum sp. DA384]|uniref:hypothetical protein n=1 Tax=Halalkalibaculum sp. DA384 TaxID=3373606 RepID=UPI0037545C7D
MPLEIHEDCQDRLAEFLTANLPQVSVNNQLFVNYKSLEAISDIDDILPQNDDFQDQLHKWIGENPLSSFIFGKLQETLESNYEYNSDQPTQNLNEIEEFEEIEELANSLIDDFIALPNEYNLLLKIPRGVATRFIQAIGEEELSISENLSLISPNQDFRNEFPDPPKHSPKKGLAGLDFLDQQVEWNPEHLYIKYRVEGFISSYEQTTPIQRFKELCKSFIGICLALRLLSFEHNYLNSSFESKILVFKSSNETWFSKKNHTFSESFSNRFQSLDLWSTWEEELNENQISTLIVKELQKIQSVFRDQDNNETILKSSQWLFDSYCSENKLLGFIQSITSIEILLGDKSISDIIGLGELLRNRCAYLIGKSKSQRDEILKDFKRIYDTRSKIVHRGKSTLSESEVDDFYKLRWLCMRAIQEEVTLLNEDED